MIENNLQVFIDAVMRYFSQTMDRKVEVGSPYLIETDLISVSDYTGVIAISGIYQGSCYFTAPQVLLKYLLLAHGEKDTSQHMLLDVVGEVANNLSGNVRKDLGRDFIISAPSVHHGKVNITSTVGSGGGRTYAIPIMLNSYKALLGICLSESKFQTAA